MFCVVVQLSNVLLACGATHRAIDTIITLRATLYTTVQTTQMSFYIDTSIFIALNKTKRNESKSITTSSLILLLVSSSSIVSGWYSVLYMCHTYGDWDMNEEKIDWKLDLPLSSHSLYADLHRLNKTTGAHASRLNSPLPPPFFFKSLSTTRLLATSPEIFVIVYWIIQKEIKVVLLVVLRIPTEERR